MNLETIIRRMPKVELHVHLEGSIRPETLLILAGRNKIDLPAQNVEELREWYTFQDFDHFLKIYKVISLCLCTPADIELIAREFLAGQAAQNILYSEVTYTPYTQFSLGGIGFEDQLAALNRANAWAEEQLGVSMALVLDISRNVTAEEGMQTAVWAVSGMGRGVCALGLGGPEIGNPPEKFEAAFRLAEEAGLPSVPHAGETSGPDSIWGAIDTLKAVRIGHGVRCLEDPALVNALRERNIPLEVCPTSNVCLKVAPDFASHPLAKLISAGLLVTLNSDDPPMFNTTLTDEYLQAAKAFNLGLDEVEDLVFTALDVSLLSQDKKYSMRAKMKAEFELLKNS